MKILLSLVALYLCCSVARAQTCQPPPQGWSVRICLHDTQANGIIFSIGVGGNSDTHRYWREWHRGDPTDIPLPIDLIYAKEIWIKVKSMQRGKNIYVCVRFNGHTTQHIDCDNDEEHETSRDDDDECNCN